VSVGFRAFDPHELLVHFLAEHAGLYPELGIEVELVDLRRAEAPHDATVACGAALFHAIGGAPVEILLIASAAPLFWLYGRAALPGSRVASYPPGAPPARFLELALGESATFLTARDDAARLALVRSGQADSALLSSATPGPRVPDLRQLFCLADRVRVPSTGIAAPPDRGRGVDRLVDAHRRALGLLARDRGLGEAAARDAFGFVEHEAEWVLDAATRHFTADGRVPAAYVDAALAAVGASRSPYTPDAISLKEAPR
jgi:hypothetical protein